MPRSSVGDGGLRGVYSYGVFAVELEVA